MLSVIIPSYKDKFLFPTIQSILDNATGDIEIIPVIDGYTLDRPMIDDERVRPVVLDINVGMREAINIGVEHAQGEYIMRTDEHCMYAPGFDSIILDTIEDNWIVCPRRYFLDPYEWAIIKSKGYVDFERLFINETHQKFAAVKWKKRSNLLKNVMIAEDMAIQGSCWIMPKKWWEKVIVRLQSDGYGILYQDSIEMTMKTWKAGGRLVLNKNTWYAHKHRDFNRTHNYPGNLARDSWKYALDTWKDYYINEVKLKFSESDKVFF